MDWLQSYTRIAFQLHAALEAAGTMYMVDTYYGPEAWRSESPPDDLAATLREIETLGATLPAMTEDARRIEYLRVQLRALETLCRHLMGEPMTLSQTARDFLDIEPTPIPDAVLDDYRRMLLDALGGTGTLAERYALFEQQLRIYPKDDDQLRSLYQRATDEARRRTYALLPLPEEEGVELQVVRNVFYGGANWYLGQGRSKMEINADRPMTLLRLLLLACHEGYPGHHTESVLKEQSLYRDLGYMEQSLFFNGPSTVVAEGIATLAGPMIFPPEEAAAWLEAEYAALGQPITGVDLPLFMKAFWAVDPDSLSTNALLKFEAGDSLETVVEYALQYALHSEAEVRRFVSQLQEAPLFRQVYSFSYYHGRALMQPLLQGADRAEMWRRFHTEQITPDLLRKWQH